MKLRALEIDQFRKFDRPVRIEGIGDGLNLIVGPNELGKSTVLAALQAVLFEKHRSTAQSVKDLQHFRHRTAPTVALEMELDGARYRIEKRFVLRPMARLTLADGRRIEGDEAEEELARLLGLDGAAGRRAGEGTGPWAVLWAGQGEALAEPAISGSARRALQACLEAEVGQIIGGRKAQAVLAAVEASMFALVTPAQGRPRGRYLELANALRDAEAEISELEHKRESLGQETTQLEAAEAEYQRLAAEDVASEEHAQLKAASEQCERLLRRRNELEAAGNALERTRLELERAEAEQAGRQEIRARLEAAAAQHAKAQELFGEAAGAAAAGETALSEARGRLTQVEEDQARAQRRTQQLERLHELFQRRDDRRAALAAAAPTIAFAIEPAALDRVTAGGKQLPASEHVTKAPEPLEIAIEGVGRIEVRPEGERYERHRRDLAEAERQMSALLGELGMIGPRAGKARRDRQLELGLASSAAAPPDRPTIAAALADGRTQTEHLSDELRIARQQVEERREAWHGARATKERAAARLEAGTAQLDLLQGQLSEMLEHASDEELLERRAERRRAFEAASAELRALQCGATDEAVEANEQQARSLSAAIDQRQARLRALELDIDRLRARIQVHAGEGLEERLDQAWRRRDELARELAGYDRELKVLALLRNVLMEAESEAKDRYLAPLAARITAYLALLFPGARPVIGEDFAVRALGRPGTAEEEPFGQLSHGTREQIAVLCRLAFAELLADQGRPAVVVLDDALAFSDDVRLEHMFEALERAAGKIQILVLTCREQAFRKLKGTRLRLIETAPQAALQA
jgi:energy-coupling factor transporter ATP-binding protein EcfA2